MTDRPTRHRIAANLFGIPFGLAGLAQGWTVAYDLGTAPVWPAQAWWALTGVVWLLVAVAYLGRHHRPVDLARELADPTFGPFVAVAPIVATMLGGALGRAAPTVGHIVFAVALVLTLLAGGWLSGQWILSDTTLAQWHPGYFLPTVGGGLVAAAVAAGFGDASLARVLFGYGVVCWFVLGSILFTRLFTQPTLPVPLRPTLAIEMAPPVVAGIAWFRINGAHVDTVALGLAGYALLMAMIQIRVIPFWRAVPFGPGWWAFSFPYAATTVYAVLWLSVEHAAASGVWTWVLLGLATGGVSVLLARTVVALARGRFLPPSEPVALAAPRSPVAVAGAHTPSSPAPAGRGGG